MPQASPLPKGSNLRLQAPSAVLVADIGGTHARFAWIKPCAYPNNHPTLWQHYQLPTADHTDLAHAIKAYWQLTGYEPQHLPDPPSAIIAIAAPLLGDRVHMTNASWDFSIEQTRLHLGFQSLQLINDFEAIGLVIPQLKASDLIAIGAPSALDTQQTKAVLGPGTGLGMALVVPQTAHQTHQPHMAWQTLACEGGHASPTPTTPQEMLLLQTLWQQSTPTQKHASEPTQRIPYISWENILSGAGLMRLHQAICQINHLNYLPMSPAELMQAAFTHGDPTSLTTLNSFCAWLGHAAGNLALTCGARGGIYLTGGVLHHIMTLAPHFLHDSAFRQNFDAKGSYQSYMQSIPTCFIKDRHIALRGCATLSCL